MHHLYTDSEELYYSSIFLYMSSFMVRFFALRRIEPHTPLLVRAPVNSSEFQPCGRTPQVGLAFSTAQRIIHPYTYIHVYVDYQGILTFFLPHPSSTLLFSESQILPTGVPPNIYAFHSTPGIPPFLSERPQKNSFSLVFS